MIELRNVSKTFSMKQANVHAVKDVSLTIEKGEIFGVIGFSGAGKSTLIRCINLLERPTQGSIHVNGEEITSLSDKELRQVRKKIGMIFQHFNLMKSRTVFQNIAFPLQDCNLSKQELEDKVMNLLELVDLKEKRDAYPSMLSGGQKQRVAIARALANDPSVVLCDEATSALDPQTTRSILKLLKEVNHRLGITIVLITHEMAVIKEICDRVAIMERGEVVEHGDIIEIFSKPKAEVTKNFIKTTSSISRIYEMIEEDLPLTRLKPKEWMVHLSYGTNNTQDAILSHVSKTFEVDTSIIFANVEVLKDTPIGDMVVILRGEDSRVKEAIAYFKEHHVEVEVIQSC